MSEQSPPYGQPGHPRQGPRGSVPDLQKATIVRVLALVVTRSWSAVIML
ncbi:MAG: hypothetical protein ACR2JU_14580 [Nocardioidaceae bacterium]